MTENCVLGQPDEEESQINGFCIIRIERDAEGKPADWTFLYANEALARMEGMSADEIIGSRFFELFPERDRARLFLHYEAVHNGRSFSFDDISEDIDRFVHIDVYPIGKPDCCACVLRSIKADVLTKKEERREVNELFRQLEEERRCNAQVVELAKTMGMVYPQAASDAAKHMETVNTLATLYVAIVEINIRTHEYYVIKGAPLMEEVLKDKRSGNFDEIMHSVVKHFAQEDMRDDIYAFLDLETLAARLEKVNTVSFEYKNMTGRWFESRIIAKKYDERGRVESALNVVKDITWEKDQELRYLEQVKAAAEEAKRANLSKTNFLRRMSHDIRTPLNGIIGMLKIMDDNEGNKEKYRLYMDKILHSTDYLLSIVNNVLDIGKMESGEIELENRPFDLCRLLLDTMPIIEANAGQSSVLFIGSEDDIHITHSYVVGSPVHLNRILMNVASNAIKYNRSGGSVRVCCNELECDGMQATYEFICEDTGLGMSEEFQERAFEPFTREGKPTTTSFSGSGLGLAIVKKIIDKMGGSIELKSRENAGTTIRIRLTLALDQNPEIPASADNEPETIDLTGCRALLVEDNEINMEIARVMLEGMGLEITSAWNGREAVDIFRSTKPYTFDFIFMDMMMPVMDGLDATRAIRALQAPDAESVPIIAMTANAFSEDRKACLDAGMNEHIGKPVDNRILTEVLRKFADYHKKG